MKTLCVILFATFLAIAVAEDASLTISPAPDLKAATKLEQQRETKSTKAYKLAKEACVKSSDGKLKGKKLTECIVNYQKETK